MPDLISAALIEREDVILAAHRKEGRRPFAGQWLLPMTVVGRDETAEEALRRHAREQFGIEVAGESFVDTVYLEDPDGRGRYVANIFRTDTGGAPLRFRAGGDYDDVRWLAPHEFAQLWMPPPMREAIVAIASGAVPAEDALGGESPADAVPLAERINEPAVDPEPAPDNRAGWDAISRAYQDERYGDRNAAMLMWSWRASEQDLKVLDDVRGKRAIVLGCGGGQDVVALSSIGAVAVGVDISAEQIAYARKYALRHAAENASFVEGSVEDLSRFDDESFDLAVSIHVLDYVEHADRALSEAARVVRPGGALALAVKHPFDVCVDAAAGGPPYAITAPYWREHADWTWEFKNGATGHFRQYPRTMAQWFELVSRAGFATEQIFEPKEDVLPRVMDDELDDRWMGLLPYTLIIKARKR